ncbi:Gfo/Idh/MocA family protein [Streptococcus sp. E24BD]|uniref:Gfo/Idh/MocA family protein n=1 Tax=Streptococcus sp. E24BD TaxID=3278715 RepID=UPI00359E66EA
MRIGIVGIGGICQKAYLPYLRQLTGVEWHLFTRNQAVLAETASLFGVANTYQAIEDLLAVELDGVMIHAATVAHVELASQFLRRGIPIYMDKPLAEDYEAARQLYALAEKHNTFLMAGFNRRFAPRVTELTQLTNKTHIRVEKNDTNRPADLTFKLYDLFIHPLDTALFLANGRAVSGDFRYYLTPSGQLRQVAVTLETDQAELIHIGMNLQAGSRHEVMDIQTPQATYQLENLDKLTIIEGDDQQTKSFGSWDTTLYKRGFESIVDAFLTAIKTKQNPVDPTSSLLSHWLCHQINHSKTSSGQLQLTLPE